MPSAGTRLLATSSVNTKRARPDTMDPLTQGVVGAALPQATTRKAHVRIAGAFGFLAGMAADIDIFIRSDTDPLLYLEFHRQFTHALIFIPVGGLICGLALHWLLGQRWRLSRKESVVFCTLGYATHALLDTCTSYGTLLLWPFSNERFAWSIVSVIDPLFTAPVLLLVLAAALLRKPVLARAALAWALLYLAAGAIQHQAARNMGLAIAASRGHQPVRLEVKPSFGNIVVWKVIYETQDRYYVDAVRAGISPMDFPGESVPKLDIKRDLPWLDSTTQQARDIERFRWFSDGFIAQDPKHPNRVIDVRYSLLPNQIDPLWSIALSPDASPTTHARYLTHRDNPRQNIAELWTLVTAEER